MTQFLLPDVVQRAEFRLTFESLCNIMLHRARNRSDPPMPVEISGKRFFTVTDLTEIVGVTRQTIWRWRRDGRVPTGRRYRGQNIVFTREEVEEIYAHAHRLEPSDVGDDVREQLKLFDQNDAEAQTSQ